MTKKIGIIGFGEIGKRHGLEFRDATCKMQLRSPFFHRNIA